MRKTYWVLIIALAFFVLPFVLVYQFFGLKENFQFRKYLADLPSEESVETTANFYTGVNRQMVGGVLALVGKGGVWLWKKTGLAYYKYTSDSSFLFLRGCTPNGLGLSGFVGDENNDPYNPEKYTNVMEWKKLVSKGMHVFMVGSGKYFVAHPDVKVTNHPLIFCQQSMDLYE